MTGWSDPQVGLELLVDVAQGGRDVDAHGNREAEAMSLARAVVRILTEDDHPGVGVGRQVQRCEDVLV